MSHRDQSIMLADYYESLPRPTMPGEVALAEAQRIVDQAKREGRIALLTVELYRILNK